MPHKIDFQSFASVTPAMQVKLFKTCIEALEFEILLKQKYVTPEALADGLIEKPAQHRFKNDVLLASQCRDFLFVWIDGLQGDNPHYIGLQ